MILNKNSKVLLLFFIFISFFEVLSASIENKIILKVENEIITNYEIKNKILISLMLVGDEVNQKNINNLKKQAVESLIQLKLKKIELDKYDIRKNDTKINAYLNSISSNNIIDLKNQFINKNLDYQAFLNEIEVQFKWQDLIYKIYSKKINIDEKSLNQEIKNYVSNNSEVIEYKISEIEIFLNNNELDKKKIFELEKRIEEEGFENSALKYSESPSSKNRGNLGWVNSKSLNEEIYNILKKMKKNEISKPINRQNSILYLKLNDIRSSKTDNLDLEKLRNNLITQKTNELFNLYSRSHLSKLRNTSIIEYK